MIIAALADRALELFVPRLRASAMLINVLGICENHCPSTPGACTPARCCDTWDGWRACLKSCNRNRSCVLEYGGFCC